ncbi:TVP38/TMEM64 family protein [Geodermatophilus ruber]|uniref:TVP38/TMEM64 family membrane protein n=1 Tax=Geodermatophilus ruber TaxID=504800 RepID=A0A1I4HML9_9ACTN|nr:VTT domain-containing protein [Geodermatophilus ruber]SFL43384.1 Uncharacterized membrane protein YdjX, TVP38/TMEM64 family, SNARE-associated domain [Geodermatophilus ruber]
MREEAAGPAAPAGRARWRLAALGGVLVLAVVLALTVDRPTVSLLRDRLDAAGPGGWLALVLGVALASLTPVPRTAVALLLGAAVGFTAGLTVAVAGGLLGGLVGFGLSRALGREAVARLAGPVISRRPLLARADRLLRDRGFLAVLTARITPLPFVAVTYAAGLTGVRLAPYALGTAVGVVPGSVLHVGVGAAVLGWA